MKMHGISSCNTHSSTASSFVLQVVATDLDSGENGKIAYSITFSTAPGLFAISADGDVSLQGSLDFERDSTYTLNITAEDNGLPSLSTDVVLKVFVTDVNEQPRISCVGSCIYFVREGRLFVTAKFRTANLYGNLRQGKM